MSDESKMKLLASLGLNYQPAIESTKAFEKSIDDLNTQLETMKKIAMDSAKDVNNSFSSQLGKASRNKAMSEQFKTVTQEAQATATAVGRMAKEVKSSNLATMQAQAAYVQQRVSAKGLSDEYGKQATTLREQLSVIQARLQAEGKLSAEETEQTQQLKEQLDILRAQTRAASHDENRLNPPTPYNEFENKASWFTDGAKFYAVSKAAKEAENTIKDVEMGMVEISRVMNDSSFVFDEYRDTLLKFGVDYGQTFDNVQSVALRWAQSGYNVADSLTLTETSMLALNTAELDATSATESMIGIMAQWQLQAEDLALVMDKVNITADNYSVTSQDLVDGLLRSSGAAKVMGMSLDDTIATLTVLREASGRTGAEVGNALSSILSYIQRDKSIDVMESLGIKMFADEAKTEFSNVMEIFEELSVKWKDPSISDGIKDSFMAGAQEAGLFAEELANVANMQEEYAEMTKLATEAQGEFTDIEKRDAAQAAAGVYRRNYFIGLLERFSETQNVLNGLVDAGGYSLEENAKTMDTLEKKQESLKASVEALAVAIGDAGLEGALKGLADGGTTAINVINDLPKPMKDLLLATTSTFTAVKTLEWGMKTFGIQIPGISQMIGSLTSGTLSLSSALKAGKDGALAFASANAPLLALSAVVGIVMSVTNAIKKQKEEQEKAIEVFNSYKGTHQELDGLLDSYEGLASKSSLATEEQEKLIKVKQQIIDILPESQSVIDNENLSLSEQIEILDKLNERELERLRIQATEVVSKGTASYEKDKKRLDELIAKMKELELVRTELIKKNSEGIITQDELALLKESAKLMGKYRDEVVKLEDGINAFEASTKFLNEEIKKNTDNIKDNADALEDDTDKIKANQEAMDELTKSFDDSTAKLIGYYTMLGEANSKEGLSAKSKQDIISKNKELLPYLNDEKELRKQLMKIISDEEKVQAKAYNAMLMSSKEFYDYKIKGNSELVNKLNEYYGVDFTNFKTLAGAKAEVDLKLIEKLSGAWGKYYKVVGGQLQQTPDFKRLMDFHLMGDESATKEVAIVMDAVKQYRDAQKAFDELVVDLAGMDFKGINTSGIKDPKKEKSKKDPKYENKALDNALKMLEHRKKITEETKKTIQEELNALKQIDKMYVKTADEKMAMTERIYSVEKRLRDRTLQDSVNWINQKKSFDELSVQEEIEAWERVRKNQVGNIDAVKQATLNLYKLREQLRNENLNREEGTIAHLTKIGVMGVEDQIKAYEELYKIKATSIEDERKRTENLFGLYKGLLKDQERDLKDSHSNNIKQIESASKTRIEAIERESKLRQDAQNDIIKGIEKELELLNAQEEEYDHDKKMADLHEQLAYWEVRTSEDARKKVIDIKKQIDEANHKREVDLQKKALNEKKKNAEDEIRNEEDKTRKKIKEVEESTRKEVELAEKAYEDIEIAFDEHSIDMIALASSMSKDMFDEFQKNYLDPLQKALKENDYNSVNSIMGGVNDFAQGAYDKTYNSTNAQVNRLANQILSLKNQYEYQNDKSAAKRVDSIYNELSSLKPDVANNLHKMDYKTAQEYVKNLPKMHKGGKSLSYGAVEMMPGELTFPPDLSIKLEGLIGALYQRPISTNSNSSTDNRRQVNIENLVRVENMRMEDEVDERSFSREIERQLSSIV